MDDGYSKCPMTNYDDFDDYLLWLCNLVDADLNRYSTLMFILHDTDFVWCLERDDGRAADGLALREEFCREDISNDWVAYMEKPCSVLEALIGLSRRMDDILTDESSSNRVRVWFWEMLVNLRLKQYTDWKIFDSSKDDPYDIQTILLRWMNREFARDGYGSPFPLRNASADQREKTMIYQMNAYVLERYLEFE